MEKSFNVANELNGAVNDGNIDLSQYGEVDLAMYLRDFNRRIKLTRCLHCDGLFFINVLTGEKISAKCKSYSCEYCGPRKAFRLEQALAVYFKQFKHIRMFTFTFRTTAFDNAGAENKAASEIWRRFVNNLRRCNSLVDAQKNVNFVRVLEFTKRGYPHFHCFFMEYLPIQVIQGLWNNAVNKILGSTGCNGNVNVSYSGPAGKNKGKPNFTAESAAKYAAKYVLKAAREKKDNMRLWSKSNSVSIFPSHISTGEWTFLNMRSSLLNLEELSVTSRPLADSSQKIKSFYEIVNLHFAWMNTEEKIQKAKELSIQASESGFV